MLKLLRYITALFYVQVKPLLQVTNTEEKLNKKESELRQVTEHLTVLRGENDLLKTEHQQLTNDKVLLTEQLRAEQDLSAETEEVWCLFYAQQNSTLGFIFVLLDVEFCHQFVGHQVRYGCSVTFPACHKWLWTTVIHRWLAE